MYSNQIKKTTTRDLEPELLIVAAGTTPLNRNRIITIGGTRDINTKPIVGIDQ